MKMKKEYIEGIYAGWLAKIIGIRLGAAIEGDTYAEIREKFGELWDYPAQYKTFAADDDSNGPLFYLRAIEDSGKGENFTPQDVGNALLNYAPYEHGFFWWGGYGISTEHTAYLNLWNGVPAPRSGSIEQNGSTVAEQIGGQIFVDSWGLVNPGNPKRAAEMARKAASVTHGGNGVYGGMFVASCIAAAFDEKNIEKVIRTGLSMIPTDCEYARVVNAVMAFHHQHPENWRECYQYIFDNFGYDRYPGNCHIIPNIAVMILGLLYGEGDFTRTICITNMCGWDTDCNTGNVATIAGVLYGLSAIDYEKWRRPIDDVVIFSSSVGSLNISDVPGGALYILKTACQLNHEPMPEPYRSIAEKSMEMCHFEYPGSTHHMMCRVSGGKCADVSSMEQSTDMAHTGSGSLKITLNPSIVPGENIYVYRKTYYTAEDFSDHRYDPEFSPTLYPGMTIHGCAALSEAAQGGVQCCLYVHERRSGQIYTGEMISLEAGKWDEMEYTIPRLSGALIDEMGIMLTAGEGEIPAEVYLDDIYSDGAPDYFLDLAAEETDHWYWMHDNITQFVRIRGLMYLEDGQLHLTGPDFAAASTGKHSFTDYKTVFRIIPVTGSHHYVNVRVQGSVRSYVAALLPQGRFGILKNNHGYKVLTEEKLNWKPNTEYEIIVTVKGNMITAETEGIRITAKDDEECYKNGSVGIATEHGSHMILKSIDIRGMGE